MRAEPRHSERQDLERHDFRPADALPRMPDAAAIDAIARHRRFGEALDHAGRGIVALFEGNRMLATVMSDRVRVLLAVAVLCLDADPDAEGRRLTPARMIAMAREHGLGSPGRVKAMLAVLRWGGYLAAAEGMADRRERPLVPTEKLWAAVTARWQVLLEAVAMLDPRAGAALAISAEPAFRPAFARALARLFGGGYRPLAHAPRLRSCADRDAGFMVLTVLTLARRDGVPAPPIAHLASRFGVSRAHVLALLREAEAAGLVARTSEGIAATELLEWELRRLYASVFAMTAAAAAAAIDAGR